MTAGLPATYAGTQKDRSEDRILHYYPAFLRLLIGRARRYLALTVGMVRAGSWRRRRW